MQIEQEREKRVAENKARMVPTLAASKMLQVWHGVCHAVKMPCPMPSLS